MFNRDSPVNWEMNGSKTLLDKALEKFNAIMASDDVYELPADKAAEVEKVLKQAHAALVKE